MKIVSTLGFLALIVAPILHAELLPFVRGERRKRVLATSGALGALVVAGLLASQFYVPSEGDLYAHLALGSSAHELHFVLDALNAPLIVLMTVLPLAVVLAAPRGLFKGGQLRALLWLEGLLLLSLVTADLAVLAVAWVAQVLPVYLHRAEPHSAQRRASLRVGRVYHGISITCFVTACGALGYWTRPSGFLDMSLIHIDTGAVPVRARPVLFALLAIAALIRMGVTPFHSWLPVALSRGPSLLVALIVSARTGLYLLTRLALPAFPDAGHAAMPVLTTVALVSALYGAIAALSQQDLRRMLGFWLVSQSGIMLTGLVFGDAHSVSGTLLYWLGFGISTIGLSLMISALEARSGSVDMRDFGGVVRRLPTLAACFFLMGIATIAVPGTVAFVAEDMLVHGALETHPMLTLVMIVAMVLNAITFMRAFTTTFLGEVRAHSLSLGDVRDLLPRERLTVVTLLLMLITAGIFPGVLVSAQEPAAKAIAIMEQLGN
jgi:NADH-quinone oxidoreductase subunit M